MKYEKLVCDNAAQDSFCELYLALASGLINKFELRGRACVREGVRLFAAALGTKRREYLKSCARKPNLQNIFTKGGPLPCGSRCDKEWISVSPQEVFVNVVSCPYADVWNPHGLSGVGQMYCEEFYPAYLHACAGEKAQINLGKALTNEGDNMCRLSVYLRPANLPHSERNIYFDEFDLSHRPVAPMPAQPIDYHGLSELLYDFLKHASDDKIGAEGAVWLYEHALSHCRKAGFDRMLHHIK